MFSEITSRLKGSRALWGRKKEEIKFDVHVQQCKFKLLVLKNWNAAKVNWGEMRTFWASGLLSTKKEKS